MSKDTKAREGHRDPVTGDILTGGEYISWVIQGIIRRWSFLVAITLITVLAWSTFNPIVLSWWNLSASYLALVIESIVGIAMFSQTRRDAVVLREVRTLNQRLEKIVQQDLESDLFTNEMMREITNELHQRLDILEDMVEENTELTKIRRRGRLTILPSSLQEEDQDSNSEPSTYPAR